MIQQILPWLQTAVSLCTLIGLLYAFYRFTRKPNDDMEAEIEAIKKKQAELELKLVEVERSLMLGNCNFQALKEVVEGITSGVLAIVDFEITYCARTGYDKEGGDLSDLKAAQNTIRNLKKKT